MERINDWKSRYALSLAMSALCGLWLWMFMPILSALGLLYSPNTLIPVFIGMVIFQSFRSKVVSLVIALLGSTSYMAYYFSPPASGGFAKLSAFLKVDLNSMMEWVQGKMLVEPVQTHLFVLLLFVLYWLIVYASTKRYLWCFYNGLAIIVLCIVDANTVVHPNQAVLVIVLIFLFVLGLQRYLVLKNGLKSSQHRFVKYFSPLVCLVGAVAAVGLLFPKPQESLGNPIQWVKHPFYNGARSQSIGFQTNNSKLGGSFSMNNDPVFSVIEPYASYIRGSVYSMYTGYGWEEPNTVHKAQFSVNVPTNALMNYTSIPNRDTAQKITVLSKSLNTDVVFGGYSIQSIQRITNLRDGKEYSVDLSTGGINGPKTQLGDIFTIRSLEPETPYPILERQPAMADNSAVGYPASILPYLQVPPTLPRRVNALAHKIAAGADTELAKVNRIKNYLQTNYPYETQGIPVPRDGQDYVDQFLFESKKGYCNNFSSSMAIMLRTLQIPTRWVVGFTTGVRDNSYLGADSRYIIRNSDAHSWVEVYFPNIGWIPFDPTPDFTFPFAPPAADEMPGATDGSSSPVKDLGTVRRYLNKEFPAPQQHTRPQAQSDPKPSMKPQVLHPQQIHVMRWVAYATVVILVGVFVALWACRRKILLRRYGKVWRGDTPSSVTDATLLLFRLLEKRQSLRTQPRLTLRDLRELSMRCEISEEDYHHFVHCAEQIWYGQDTERLSVEDYKRFQNTWTQWITHILAVNPKVNLTMVVEESRIMS